MLRAPLKGFYNNKIINQIPNIYKNIANNFSFVCSNHIANDKTLFTSKQQILLPCPVKLEVNQPSCYIVKRYKSKKRNKSQSQEDDTEEDEEEKDENDWEADEPLGRDAKIMKIDVLSARMDYIAKRGFGMSRNKIETLFYESKFRLNGLKILKKGTSLRTEDQFDYIKGISPDNPEFLLVSRLEILDMVSKGDSIRITMKKYPHLIIEDYKEPWQTKTDELS